MTAATLPITSNKVRDLTPTWERFCGLSILWDDPPEEERDLYRGLAGVVAGWDLPALRDELMFCPLPPESYHVTLCDGVNQTRTRDLPRACGRAAVAYVKGLPHTLLAVPECLFPYFETPVLAEAAAHPVTFAVSGVEVRGHALVAALAPATPADEAALAEVQAARAELVETVQRELRIETQDLLPHVSLGYFANRDLAERAAAPMAARSGEVVEALAGRTVRYESASVYGFTDMVTFWRHPGRNRPPTPGAW